MSNTRIELLGRTPVFAGVRKDILELIVANSTLVDVWSGDYLFREGDPGDSMYVLERGTVSVLISSRGREQIVGTLGIGDCIGEMALMDASPRSASIRAEEHCIAVEISSSCLNRVHHTDVEQFALIEMNMGREVSRRLRAADRHLLNGL
jgi:CRP-like cAMP-binding protein